MKMRDEYLSDAKLELGERVYADLSSSIDNDYYSHVESQAKQGIPISRFIYNNLSKGQRYHFNKHYNYRGDMVKEF